MTEPVEKPSEAARQLRKRTASPLRWSKTLVNFWLDCLLASLFLLLVWVTAVLRFLFPVGATTATVTLWGGDVRDWRDVQFVVLCVFTLGILLHVMFHWTWICGVVMKHLLGRPPSRDDGSQTLVGVGLIVAILHLLGGALLFAWYCLREGTSPAGW